MNEKQHKVINKNCGVISFKNHKKSVLNRKKLLKINKKNTK